MASDYRPATDAELRLLRDNGFVPEQVKVKYSDEEKLVCDNYRTGHEIWIIRGICRQWL